MFKTVKRIIDWCGEFKSKLYLGFVMTFFSHIFAAMPLALAAWTVGQLIESRQSGAAFDASDRVQDSIRSIISCRSHTLSFS